MDNRDRACDEHQHLFATGAIGQTRCAGCFAALEADVEHMTQYAAKRATHRTQLVQKIVALEAENQRLLETVGAEQPLHELDKVKAERNEAQENLRNIAIAILDVAGIKKSDKETNEDIL